MSVESYLLKPTQKEYFYLGKHFPRLDGIVCSQYRKIEKYEDFITHAKYLDYECFHDMLMDYIDESDDLSHLYYDEIVDTVYSIYEWAKEPVIHIYDGEDCFKLLNDCKQTESILDLYDEFKNRYQNLFTIEEQLDDLLDLIPHEYWVTNEDKVILTVKSIEKYLISLRGEQK